MCSRIANLFTSLLFAAVCFGEVAPVSSRAVDDRAVIAAALEDFAHWRDATFGKFEGGLAVESLSASQPEATVEDVKSLAPNIRAKISDAVAASFVERNKIAAPVASMIEGTKWAVPYVPPAQVERWQRPPAGTKATGNLTVPGYSSNGATAIVQIHHSWSVHGAVVTYLLIKKGSRWHIAARDQAVFL